MNRVLEQIIAHKQKEVARQKLQIDQATLIRRCQNQPPVRNFISALRDKHAQRQAAVIAEVKRASPSQGVIRDPFDPAAIARSYQRGGAACLSVLTDEKFFQGHADNLSMAKAACDLPILRKDFILDSYQIYQARAMGADAILLIVAALDDKRLFELYELALTLDLAVLVESHDLIELQRALRLPTPLIGINNRDLQTFTTDLATTIRLAESVPDDRIIISESGIHQEADIEKLQAHGIQTYLIGESCMRAKEPGEALQGLIGRQ